jgi:hypothetical protein
MVEGDSSKTAAGRGAGHGFLLRKYENGRKKVMFFLEK